MGITESKIEDRRRAKIYKRVNFIEARRQFLQLPFGSSGFKKKFDSFPISQNFESYFSDECSPRYGKGLVLYLESVKGVELDSEKVQRCTVYHLLKADYGNSHKVRTVPAIVPSNYFIGLNREQYDELYPSELPVSTVSTFK